MGIHFSAVRWLGLVIYRFATYAAIFFADGSGAVCVTPFGRFGDFLDSVGAGQRNGLDVGPSWWEVATGIVGVV